MNVVDQTAKVRVFKPCDCVACATGRRWFWCERLKDTLIAEYACDPIGPEDPAVPHPDSVRHISAAHPGTILVYVDGR